MRAEPVVASRGGELMLALANRSSIDYDIEVDSGPAWLTLPAARLAREATTPVRGRLTAAAPPGAHSIRLQVRVANLQPSAGVALEAEIEVKVTIE